MIRFINSQMLIGKDGIVPKMKRPENVEAVYIMFF